MHRQPLPGVSVRCSGDAMATVDLVRLMVKDGGLRRVARFDGAQGGGYLLRRWLRLNCTDADEKPFRAACERALAKYRAEEPERWEEDDDEEDPDWVLDDRKPTAAAAAGKPPPVLVVTDAQLSFCKAAGYVGTRSNWSSQPALLSLHFAAHVLTEAGARADVIAHVLAAAERAVGACVDAAAAKQALLTPVTKIIGMPMSMPELPAGVTDASAPKRYGLTEEQLNGEPLCTQLAEYASWSKAALQPSRKQQSRLSDATLDKVRSSVRRVLGFAANVLGVADAAVSLDELFNGETLALYVRWGTECRKKTAGSLACELQDVDRLIGYRLDRGVGDLADREALTELQASVKSLAGQCAHLPGAVKPSIEELRTAGKYIDLAELMLAVDAYTGQVDTDGERTKELANDVQDALMLRLTLRESAPKRPRCWSEVLLRQSTDACAHAGCSRQGCRGNSVVRHASGAFTVHLSHFKTSKSHAPQTLPVAPDSVTGRLLAAQVDWARPMLLSGTQDHRCLWVGRGGAQLGPQAFAKRMPRTLQRILSHTDLGWNRIRHIVASAALTGDLTDEQVEGVASSMQTSVRKLKGVYHDDREAYLTSVGDAAWKAMTAAPQGAGVEGTQATDVYGPSVTGVSGLAPALAGRTPAVATGDALSPLQHEFDAWDDSDDEAHREQRTPARTTGEDIGRSGPLALMDSPLDFDALLASASRKRPQGRSESYVRPDERMLLTAAQVDRLLRAGGQNLLVEAFRRVYGATPAKRGAWLRDKITSRLPE